MAKNISTGKIFIYSLPFIVGGVLIYTYLRKKKRRGLGTPSTPEEKPQEKDFKVIKYVSTSTSPLNVRKEPTTSSQIVAKLPRGTKVFAEYVGDANTAQWMEVSQDGVTSLGYASTLFLSSTKPTTTTGTSTSTSGQSGGMTGTGGTTSGYEGTGRPRGFANFTQKYVVSTSSGSLNIRNAPNTSATILEKAPKGTIYLGRPSSTSGWIEISKDGSTVYGYASSMFLSVKI